MRKKKSRGRFKVTAIICMAAAICCAVGSCAESVVLPSSLTEIGEEAFAGNTGIHDLVLPDSLQAIGERAFHGCSGLAQIYIPESVQSIGLEAFRDCTDDLLIISNPGSPAMEYAIQNQNDYRCGTRYRALLIAQSYEDVPDLTLEGPENDVAALSACLALYAGTNYEVSVARNLTASGILSSIQDAFGAAESQDVSLFYYSGHGMSTKDTAKRGALVGNDGNTHVTADQLRSALDRIPGRKIVIIDACYSGNLIQEADTTSGTGSVAMLEGTSEDTEGTSEHFVQSFISAFSRRTRGGLAGESYFVLTSAADNELCYEEEIDGTVYGLFTSMLFRGCGYQSNAASADSNGNGVLTFQEIYQYTHKKLVYDGQHVQGYPMDCSWFGILRER